MSQIDNQRLTALVFVVFLGLVAGCGEKKTAENPDAEAAEPVGVVAALPEFTLIDQGGVSFGSADLNGKVWIADFIFTRCAGTCPMQTAEKVKLQEKLRKHAAWDEIQLVSFTVDPDKLREKLSRFLLPEPHAYILKLVQWAVAAGASRIKAEVGQRQGIFCGRAPLCQ